MVDQFAPKQLYYSYLRDEPNVIRTLRFETKAENKYPAVGAASIIARNTYELYTVSPRKYDGDYDVLEYPPGFQVRKVTGVGEIIINGIRITIGYALRGWHVGLQPLPDENSYYVFLADFLLGTLNMDFCCFIPLQDVKSKKVTRSEGKF